MLKARPRRSADCRCVGLVVCAVSPESPQTDRLPKGRHCALRTWIEPLSSPLSPRTADTNSARSRVTPGVAAALVGGLFGLTIGVAYLGGTMAKATTLRAQAVRLDGAASAGFTEEAMVAAAGGLDASALAIARRHDPYTVAGPSRRDRQAELLTARLEQLRPAAPSGMPGLRLASTGPAHPAASPFRLGNALDASRDLECLTQAVYYEARGEGRDGMKAVAQVVINRARHPAFPDRKSVV